jgi:hypothetical protein
VTDFTLTPDDDDSERPERRRPARLVSSGLADTAPVPRQRGPDPPPAYAPCEACGALTLRGDTAAGRRLALDVQVPCYTMRWDTGAPRPLVHASRAYPVHRCRPEQHVP